VRTVRVERSKRMREHLRGVRLRNGAEDSDPYMAGPAHEYQGNDGDSARERSDRMAPKGVGCLATFTTRS